MLRITKIEVKIKIEMFFFISVLLCGAGVSLGQKIDISNLRNSQKALTAGEKGKVADWISSQFDKISGELDKPVTKKNTLRDRERNLNKIRDTLKRTAQGSNFFRAAFFEALGKKIVAGVSDANLQPSAIEVVFLSEFKDPAVINIYRQLLQTGNSAIQVLAIKGLTGQAGELSPSVRKQIIDDIKVLAEKSGREVIPGYCYSFLGKIDNAQARQALLEILKMRAKSYLDGQASQFSDDRMLVGVIIGIHGKVSQSDQKQIVASLEGILRSAVGLVTAKNIALPEIRVQLDLLIYTTEKGLSLITGKNSDMPVISALKDARFGDAKKLLDKWK